MYLCFRRVPFNFTPVSTPRPHITTTTTDYLLPRANTMSLLPPPEAIYPDPYTAQVAIQLHAKQHGYAFFRISSKPSRVLFACDRGRKYDSKGKDPAVDKSKQRKRTGTKKCGCLMKVELRLDKVSSHWILHVLEGAHNHGPSTAATAHPAHRITAVTPYIHAKIIRLSQAGSSPSQILTALRLSDPQIPLVVKDIANIVQQMRAQELNGRTPIQWLLEVSIKL